MECAARDSPEESDAMRKVRIIDLYTRLARKPVGSKGARKVRRMIGGEKQRVYREIHSPDKKGGQ